MMAGPGHKCRNCGAGLRAGARFCTKCGHRVLEATGQPGLGKPPTPLATTAQDPVPTITVPAIPVPPRHPPTADPAQPPSPWQPAPPGPPAPPRPPGGRRPRGSLIAGIVAAAVVLGGGGAAVAIARPFSRHETAASAADTSGAATPSGRGSGSASGAAPGPAATSSASVAASVPGEAGTSAPAPSPSATSATATPARVTERQAATSVAGMLALSTTDRSAIMNAVGDVNSCGPGLNGDPGVFARAAASRRSLLARLARLPGRSALPAALVTDLTQAWQASVAADDDFARWANDEIANGCVPGNTSDPGFQAAAVPDNEATLSKKAFTALWNPVAARYHLPRYRWNQL